MEWMPRESFSGTLFGAAGKPEQGYRHVGDGAFEDPEGNLVDECGDLVREAMDPYFEAALQRIRGLDAYRGEPENFIRSLARAEAARMKAEEKKRDKKGKRRIRDERQKES